MNKNKRPHAKYSNVKTEIDGILFDSKKEAQRYTQLKLMERVGIINELKLQVRYQLDVNGIKVCSYIADFTYNKKDLNGAFEIIVEDVKGMKTPIYNLKKKMMFACHGIKILET